MVLLRPALRSTAFGRGLSYGGTVDPSPSSVFYGAEHCPPGRSGGFGRGGGK